METQVKQIMSNTFSINIEKISDDSSPDSIANWDSLKHMQLILSLEEEFGIEFSDNEVVELVSFQKIIDALKRIA